MKASRTWLLPLLIFSLSLVLVGGPAPFAAPKKAQCSRIVAMGDIHGGMKALVQMLQAAGLIDDQANWIGGDACLAQTGDLVDRGVRSREVMTLMMRLQRAEPERVFVSLGNHEVMNMIGDLRYVFRGEFEAYADLETPEDREEALAWFAKRPGIGSLTEAEQREDLEEEYPAGWFGHRKAFSPQGVFGRWLLERPVVFELDGTLFVHGGLSELDAAKQISELNRQAQEELRGFLAARTLLIEADLLNPLTPYVESFAELAAAVQDRLDRQEPISPEFASAAVEYAEFGTDSLLTRRDGPVWNRDWAQEPEEILAPRVEILAKRGIDRIAVGHTVVKSGKIRARLGGAIYLIDTGIGPAYKEGEPSALEILPDGIWAYSPDGRNMLLPERTDASVERFLRDAEIVEVVDLGTGITKPQKVTLELDGRQEYALFKSLNEEKRGYTKFPNGRRVLNYSDSYRYERPAYLLDRFIGLNRVPVAVDRKVRGKPGVLIEWIDGAVSSQDEYDGKISAPDPEDYERQQGLRRMFDALIANTDRNMGNMLIRTEDWRLYLIDHSRSFRHETELLDSFTNNPPSEVPEAMIERMRRLDLPTLRKMFGTAVNKHRAKAVLTRRDAILEQLGATP